MTTLNFKTEWTKSENNLRSISFHTLNKFKLTDEVIDFLSNSGLPDSAAPFLSFVRDFDTHEKFSTISLLTDWFDFLEPEYAKFLVIGSDGSGDIVALNLDGNCIVEWLDHEDYFSSRFMNSSITQLAGCLLAYRKFINTVNSSISDSEFYDTEFTDAQYESLKSDLQIVDSRSVTQGFWKENLDILLANREDAKKRTYGS